MAAATLSLGTGALSTVGAYAFTGAVAGATSGVGFAALSGGDMAKGALWGGIMGGALGGLLKHQGMMSGISDDIRQQPKFACVGCPPETYYGGALNEVVVKGKLSPNYMMAAGTFAATAAVIDGPLPVGDAIGLTALAGTAIYSYSSVDLIQKMNAEILGIMARATGPQGVQYSLRATESGTYPCYTCPSGTTQLNVGDVWRYGETTNPTVRYPQNFLRMNRVRMVHEFYGNQIEIKIVEKIKIYGFFFRNGHLPGGNKIFR